MVRQPINAPARRVVQQCLETQLPLRAQISNDHANDMTVRATTDYRESHQALGYSGKYNRVYEIGYYAAQWRLIEEPLLRSILQPMGGKEKTCLDFACGTGRITQVVA